MEPIFIIINILEELGATELDFIYYILSKSYKSLDEYFHTFDASCVNQKFRVKPVFSKSFIVIHPHVSAEICSIKYSIEKKVRNSIGCNYCCNVLLLSRIFLNMFVPFSHLSVPDSIHLLHVHRYIPWYRYSDFHVLT